MGQEQGAHAAGCRQGTGLPRGQVPVFTGQVRLGVGEGGLRDQQVGLLRQLLGAGARGGVHDEGEPLAATELADLVQVHPVQSSLTLQPADVRAADAGGVEPFRHQRAPVRFPEAVAIRLDAVVQGTDLKPRSHLAGRAVGVQAQVETARGQGHQRPDGRLTGGRVVQVHRVLHPVQGHPGQDPGQTVAVVTVDVGQADAGDPAGRDPRMDHLPLGALAGIEQQTLTLPRQQVAVLVPFTGRDLGGGAEDHEFAHAPRVA